MKAVIEELDTLRTHLRQALESYGERLDGEIAQVQQSILIESENKKVAVSRLRDMRDILTVLRKSQFKPEKGRRKDIKKIDALVGDLTLLIENW